MEGLSIAASDDDDDDDALQEACLRLRLVYFKSFVSGITFLKNTEFLVFSMFKYKYEAQTKSALSDTSHTASRQLKFHELVNS